MAHATIIGSYDAKTRFAELLAQAESGDEITITRHGTPVAKLVPIKKRRTPDERRVAIEEWRKASRNLSLGGLKIRELLEEGRP